MPKRILWLDNDTPFIRPYVKYLRSKDFEVDDVADLTKAESLLKEKPFDLVIVDVMVPTQNAEEQKNYPETETDYGHMTGLAFFKRMRNLTDKLPPVLVMTVRQDQEIRDALIKEGLKAENFVSKYDLREVNDLLRKIRSTLQE